MPPILFLIFNLIFCYSGDTDAVIPVTSTRYSIDALKLPTVSPWRAWYDDGQVIPSIINNKPVWRFVGPTCWDLGCLAHWYGPNIQDICGPIFWDTHNICRPCDYTWPKWGAIQDHMIYGMCGPHEIWRSDWFWIIYRLEGGHRGTKG